MFLKDIFRKAFAEGLKPTEKIKVSEWADKYRYLTAGSSSEVGRYSTKRTEYLREIMDCFLDDSGIETLAFMKSTQVGASEALNNITGYIMDINPSSTMILTSTVDAAKKYSKTRIDPMIDSCASVKQKIIKSNVQDKNFIGGNLFLFGANSPSALRSNPVKNGLFDEVDSYPLDLGNEGDPIAIAKKRGNTFPLRKFWYISTPTISGISKIEEVYLKGDQRKYFMPCPHCQGKILFDFYNLKFEKQENNEKLCIPESVYYQCDFCQGKIKEFQKTRMLERGEWIPTNKDAHPKNRSYHINALYSPLGWLAWEDIINDFLEAKTDPFKMKTFVNTQLGLPYKDKTTQPDYKKLYSRREKYSFREADKKIVFATAGADTQDDRLAYCILGFGEDNEVWVLAYNEILGDPKQPKVWKQFKREIQRPIKHLAGIDINVSGCFIDSAGHNTKYVYDFCRRNKDFFLPIVGRGDSGGGYVKNGKLLDEDENGNKYNDSLQLYIVNTILTKKTVYSYLQNDEPGQNYVHFSNDLNLGFFEMLGSEYLITEMVKGQKKEKFIKPNGVRNEALDCFSYAYAFAEMRGISNVYGEEYKKVYQLNIQDKIDQLKYNKQAVIDKEKEDNITKNEIEANKKKDYINKLNSQRKNRNNTKKSSYFDI